VLPCIALLYAFLPSAMDAARTPLLKGLFWAASVWSVLVAALGVVDPWTTHVFSVYAPLDVMVPRAATRGAGGQRAAQWIIEHTAASPSFGYYELGRFYASKRDPDRAIEMLLTSLSIETTRTLAWYQLGTVAGSTGKLDLAASAFRRLTIIEPDHAGAWANLGLSLQEMGLKDDAKGALERGLQLNPESRAARIGLARYYRDTGETTKALDFWPTESR
jgi:tetratricopeptide (TPR) repeat protein